MFVGALIFAGLVVSLLLFLWINARKKEIAVLLSIGISKGRIFLQFASEMVFISIPAFACSYFCSIIPRQGDGKQHSQEGYRRCIKETCR